MEQPSTWEAVLLGVAVLVLLFWFRPGIKASLERSQKAEKDWAGVLFPIAIVVLFIAFLVMIT